MTEIEGGKVWEYSAITHHGFYRMIVRDFPVMLDNEGIEETLDANIERVYSDGQVTFLSKRTFSYAGRPAREIVIQEKDKIQKARFYILNKKLFFLYVTVQPKKYWPEVEKWADKFLDSFEVVVQLKNQG